MEAAFIRVVATMEFRSLRNYQHHLEVYLKYPVPDICRESRTIM